MAATRRPKGCLSEGTNTAGNDGGRALAAAPSFRSSAATCLAPSPVRNVPPTTRSGASKPRWIAMHILFLTHYFPPEVNAPASRVYEMAKQWVRSGVEVTVLTCAPNAPSGRLFPGYRNRLWQRETMDGIQVVRVWSFLAANKGAVLRMVNYLSFMLSATLAVPFLNRPDIVVATSPQLFCGWAGVWAHWLRRCPLIIEIRDMWAESIATLTSGKKNLLTRFLEYVEFRLYRMTPHLVTVGPGYRQVLVQKGMDPDNVQIITNGVDLEFYQPRARPGVLAEMGPRREVHLQLRGYDWHGPQAGCRCEGGRNPPRSTG